ncbi:hypothetical protein GCM10007096_02200 [Pullulanibacillus pueri]|uniref:Uncharacterized protein n=1 Tax=Pullulanibacillus pueri TaxID=1437324 RepID=A0A8J2ZRB8_9BACL|nr:hypothetical protein GCM10007096_02200 [Pullulanibacillus pueri]
MSNPPFRRRIAFLFDSQLNAGVYRLWLSYNIKITRQKHGLSSRVILNAAYEAASIHLLQ